MASLATAKQILNSATHQAVRDQIEGALWMVAREKVGKVTTGPEFDLMVRVLRYEPVDGKTAPHVLTACRNFAYDSTLQDGYIGRGALGFTDAEVVAWVRANWLILAGMG